MNAKPHLLMIAYYFPPLGGAGVQRSAKFAKYLARLGWQVEVISVEPPTFEPLDPSLEPEVACENIKVHRLPYRESFRSLDRFPGGWRLRCLLQDWALFPDRMAGWLKPALKLASQICETNPGIAVLTTSAPYTAHLVGLQLKEKYGSYWVADFRDEWTQNPYLTLPTAYHWRKHRSYERQVLSSADLVLSVTETITAGLRQISTASRAVFETIPNGYDPEDLQGLEYRKTGRFTLTHVGTLNQARLKLLEQVIEALDNLTGSGAVPSTEVLLKLIGPGKVGDILGAGRNWLKVEEYLPHHDALRTMATSDLLILAEPNRAAYTGKIFEYLGLQRPVLGLVHPESPAARLINQAAAGWVVGIEPGSPIAKAIEESYRRWRQGQALINPNAEVISLFNRQSQTTHLAALIRRGLQDGA